MIQVPGFVWGAATVALLTGAAVRLLEAWERTEQLAYERDRYERIEAQQHTMQVRQMALAERETRLREKEHERAAWRAGRPLDEVVQEATAKGFAEEA